MSTRFFSQLQVISPKWFGRKLVVQVSVEPCQKMGIHSTLSVGIHRPEIIEVNTKRTCHRLKMRLPKVMFPWFGNRPLNNWIKPSHDGTDQHTIIWGCIIHKTMVIFVDFHLIWPHEYLSFCRCYKRQHLSEPWHKAWHKLKSIIRKK